MANFLVVAALLVLIALIPACYPLLKKHRALAASLIIGLPLLTAALYRYVGNPGALDPEFIAKNQPVPDLDTALGNLESELEAKPDNLQGWILLARTRMSLGDFKAADGAYKKAIALDPDSTDLKTERAEAMLRSSRERAFPREAVELLEQALKKDPEHERALFFMGMHFLQKGDLDRAETYLDKLMPRLDPAAASALREQINIARAEHGKPLLDAPAGELPGDKTARIKLKILIDDALVSSIKPGAVLFVFAKSSANTGPPVAAKRVEIGKFPMELELDDSDSLMPTAKFSSQDKVLLSARISMQGIAAAQKGDIEADSVITATKNKNTIEIRLSRVKQ